jgi:hypothetical protein
MSIGKKITKVYDKLKWRLRFLNAGARVWPDFLIIGASKSGTTSLWNYIVQHPNVSLNYKGKKEIQFFDQKINKNFPQGSKKSLRWYKAHFPTKDDIYKKKKELNSREVLVGEATPGYLFHPLSPPQIKYLMPNVKLIVLLRNPIKRAFSHYQHEFRAHRESLTFEEAIKAEASRIAGSFEKILSQKNFFCPEYHYHSYLERGKYYDQLVRWYKYFPKDRFLVIKSEELFEHPEAIYKKVLKFLDLPKHEKTEFEKLNQGSYNTSRTVGFENISQWLGEYFFKENQKLYELLGVDFNWELELYPKKLEPQKPR